MIADLKPYPKMKDSGVPWLGKVPEHWDVFRGRQLFEIKKRIAGEFGHPVISVTQAGLRVKDVETGGGQVSQDYSKYQILKAGEFAMNPMDLLTGGVGIASSPGVTSPDYRVFTIRDEVRCHNRFMLHVFRILYQNRGFYAWGQGSAQLGRWRLPRKRFNDFPFPVPPPSDQAAIVRLLDYADRRIQRYSQAKQKLIKLLEEQKRAIINCAVTGGLDPNVRLKLSGVEWLGDVPEHWEVVPLKRIAAFKSGTGFPISAQGQDNLEVPFLKVSDMNLTGNERYIKTHNNTISRETVKTLSAQIFSANTIIFPKVGGAMLTNKRRILFRESCIDNNLMGCVIKRGDFSYIFLLLQQIDLGKLSKPGPVPAISEGEIREIRIAIPPQDEQAIIIQWVNRTTREMDHGIALATSEISLLREYRTRLIADVVTGKLDVREAASKLPNEIEEPEPLDDLEALAEGDEEGEGSELELAPEEAEV